MTEFIPVSKKYHSNMRWIRPRNYRHTKHKLFAEVLIGEIAQIAQHYPIGFISHKETVMPACILGLDSKQNLLLDDNEQWLNGYIPAQLRTHPFALLPDPNGKLVLCIDNNSGLISSEDDGEEFFTNNGELSPALKTIFDMLGRIQLNRSATKAACQALNDHQLLTPWSIKMTTGKHVKTLEGMMRIDQQTIAQLDGPALFELNKVGALNLAYLQLFSMQNFTLIAEKYSQLIIQSRGFDDAPSLDIDNSIPLDWL